MAIRLRSDRDLERLRGIFAEMPGTRLNVVDASTLSGFDEEACRLMLSALEATGFLRIGRDGKYERQTTDSP